jgi:hypothetical protein
MNYEGLMKNLPPLLGLVVLVLVLLFVLVNFGYLRACEIPGFSSIYYGIKGAPKVALVFGTDGTGDPAKFTAIVAQEVHTAIALIPLSTVFNANAFDHYQIVIVEHAKTISTQQLWAFQKYVNGGGKLVWIGDAGTTLGPKDYICEKVAFTYKLGYDTPTGPNQTQEQCVERTEEPNTLDNSADGLCGKTFGDIVVEFVEQNKTIYESTSMGAYHLCNSDRNNYAFSNAEQILNCLTDLSDAGKEINAANANEVCSGYNYWQRGPSKSATDESVQSIDFSQLVLGIDFVKQYGASDLFMTPSGTHSLTQGYDTSTPVGFSLYYNRSNVTIVDSSRFSTAPRTSSIMVMQIGDTTYPMIATSSPYAVQINRGGLVVYYAFAPDDPITQGAKGWEGPGLRLFNNLFKYLMC